MSIDTMRFLFTHLQEPRRKECISKHNWNTVLVDHTAISCSDKNCTKPDPASEAPCACEPHCLKPPKSSSSSVIGVIQVVMISSQVDGMRRDLTSKFQSKQLAASCWSVDKS